MTPNVLRPKGVAGYGPRHPLIAHFLTENQCRWCLGWSVGARLLAGQIAGRPGRMRPCVCDGILIATGQEQLDFGGAA